jgi:hypothetical protein
MKTMQTATKKLAKMEKGNLSQFFFNLSHFSAGQLNGQAAESWAEILSTLLKVSG